MKAAWLLALALIAAPAASHAQAIGYSALTVGCAPGTGIVPGSEVVGGEAGVSTNCLPIDARLPRITRAGYFTTTAGGVLSGSWDLALPASAMAPNIIFTPVLAGSPMVTCKLTSMPTATSFAGLCRTEQALSITLAGVTAGLNLNPLAPTAAGVVIGVTALPATQAAQ